MATTLRIRNETNAELKIDTGVNVIVFAAKEEKELAEKELKSQGFAKALGAGTISFVKINKPSAEHMKLARIALPL